MATILRAIASLIQTLAQLTSQKQPSGGMLAATFVRFGGANDLGHVGWGFDVSQTETNIGAVENERGTPTCDPKDMGYWDLTVADPMPAMRERGYNSLKFVEVPYPDPIEACGTAKWIAGEAYTVIGRNCLDDVYDVLRSYGVANLPPPSIDILPNDWFLSVPGEEAAVGSYAWPRGTGSGLATALKKVAKSIVPPQIPTWRTPGHPDWHELQQSLAKERPPNSYAARHSQ